MYYYCTIINSIVIVINSVTATYAGETVSGNVDTY